MDPRAHWDRVYTERGPEEVSWFQRRAEVSLAMIAAAGVAKDRGIIDVGGGRSTLVDALLDLGYGGLAVLDVSRAALEQSRARLGDRAGAIEWLEADVTSFEPPRRFGLWHDRAVLHFLTERREREGYVSALRRALSPGGSAVVAAFAPDGPPQCSGLPVVRYDEASIRRELGPDFVLQEARRETHVTPWATEQRFIYFRFRRAR